MDSGEEDFIFEGESPESLDMETSNANNSYSGEFPLSMTGTSQLKPKLDTIFAEVEKNLPTIDFDMSDVSSDGEDVEIFQRNFKKNVYVDDDKDLDTSLNGQSMTEYFHAALPDDVKSLTSIQTEIAEKGDDVDRPQLVARSGETVLISKKIKIPKTTSSTPPPQTSENMLEKDAEDSNKGSTKHKSGTSWRDVVMEAERPQPKVQNWVETKPQEQLPDLSGAFSAMETELFGMSGDTSQSDEVLADMLSKGEKYVSETIPSLKEIDLLRKADKGDKSVYKQKRKDERRNQELEMVSNMVSSRAPTLHLKGLDKINLDLVLSGNYDDNQLMSIRQEWEGIVPPGGGDGNRALDNITPDNDRDSSKTLIQKLAELSMTQSGEDLRDIDPSTGAKKSSIPDKWGRNRPPTPDRPKNRPPTPDSADKDDIKTLPEKVTKKMTASCGTNTANKDDNMPPKIIVPRIRPKESPAEPKRSESGTVFIDLRNFDKQREEERKKIERVQKILNISIDPREESDSEEDEVSSWKSERLRVKHNLTKKGVNSPALPDKPNAPYGHVSTVKHPPRVIPLNKKKEDQEKEVAEEEEEKLEDAVRAERKAKMEAEQAERERFALMEKARKLREQKEAERQAKLRLSKQLEALRPTASISGKQDCAEATPIVFDYEASYEPAPHTLPSVLRPEQECLLITIYLSSNGEIVLHRGKSNKSVDTDVGLSASYTVLLSWLLSLVPNNFDFLSLESSTASPAPDAGPMGYQPFYVVGLQQLWLDEQHALVVAVMPTHHLGNKGVPGKVKKSKVKDEMKDMSLFQQHLSKFFSINTLHSVCPWLQTMVSVELTGKDGEDGQEVVNPYTYTPPLPNITSKPLSTFMQINPDRKAAAKVFNTSVGFFWQTVDSDELRLEMELNDSHVNYDTQNTMSLVYKKIFHDPSALMGIFNRVLQEGLDISGIRLLYPTPDLLDLANNKHTGSDNSKNTNITSANLEVLNNIGPVLALALRGTFARSIWLDAVGPSDPVLARRTDPNSLCALYGGTSREECLLFCPRNQMRIQIELARWFGGRVPPGGTIDVGTPYTRKDHLRSGSPKSRKSKRAGGGDNCDRDREEVRSHRPPASLTATTKSEIFLVLSPLVFPKCMGIVMTTCQRRGFQIRGIKRLRMTGKKMTALGLEASYQNTYCPGIEDLSVAESQGIRDHIKHQESSAPCIVLLLEKENAAHHAASLVEFVMVQLTLQGCVGLMQSKVEQALTSRHLFHTARYNDNVLTSLGGDFSKCQDVDFQLAPSFILPKLYTNPELEEIVVLLMLGHDFLKSSGLHVGSLLSLLPRGKASATRPLREGFELLGMKWLPFLSHAQAKEVTPFEAGDRKWKKSITTLTSEPALVMVLRSQDAFNKIHAIVPHPSTVTHDRHIDFIVSETPEEAFSFARAFFKDRELLGDPSCRPLLPYLPSSRLYTQKSLNPGLAYKESIFDIMQSGPSLFPTFLLVKPRAFGRHMSKIMRKIVQEDFAVLGFRISHLREEQAQYLLNKEMDEETKQRHIDSLTSDPCVYLVLERENSVKHLLDLIGPEDPQSARRHSQFYWRGIFGIDLVHNGFYCSSNFIQAMTDIKFFFPEGLCSTGSDVTESEHIPCPCVDNIIDMKYMDNRVAEALPILSEAEAKEDSIESRQKLLMQTSCLVLKPSILTGGHRAFMGYAEVLEGLINNGFELVGGRMVWMTQAQAEHFLHVVNAGSYSQVSLLVSGPSLVLAVQRENAVLAFDSLMGSNYGADSLIGHFGKDINRPHDEAQANSMLQFFFDQLMPHSIIQIHSRGK